MRLLFEMDKKNYEPSAASDAARVFKRDSARAVIFKDGNLAVIYSRKNHFYKIPGGGIESGENPVDAMIREVREEAGLCVIRKSVREFGFVHRVEKGKREPVFVQDNFYYLCEAEDAVQDPSYSDAEKEQDFYPDFVPMEDAIAVNEAYVALHPDDIMVLRELMVMRLVRASG